MQNRCNCGCNAFVPVNGNWDFNTDYTARNRQNRSCNTREAEYTRESRSNSDCQCERCNDTREVACCDQNTYIRDMDECGSTYTQTRTNSCNKCDECDSACTSSRTNSCNKCGECDSTCTQTRTNSCNKCDECDSTYTQTRTNSCNKCDECDSTYTQTRTNNCNKCDECDSAYTSSRKNRHVGMVSVETQEIDEIFESESALRAGTLFPELHKPLNGYCPCEGNCSDCAQEAAFAAWELRLYLNTHPHDKEALRLFRKLCKEAEETNYATTFLTDDCCQKGWSWVENPWPWEYSCNCGDD